MKQLKAVIENTIDEFLLRYGDRCTNELASLAFFHLFFFDLLSEKINIHNPRINIIRKTIVSNHIDKSPIVEMRGVHDTVNPTCELGDLLFIITTGKYSKAIIIQAKQNENSYRQGSTAKERLLYENWPTFEIVRPDDLTGREYNLKIELTSISRFLTFFTKEGNLKLGNARKQDQRFSDFFIEFISSKYKTGRLYRNNRRIRIDKADTVLGKLLCIPKKQDDWELLINNIELCFSRKVFQNAQTGLNNRQSISQLCFLNGQGIENIDPMLDNIRFQDNVREQFHFFSVIEITVED